MPGTTQSAPSRMIVIPRQLEGFFYERLSAQFEGRGDVRVVVERRVGERRRPRWVSGAGPFTERRRHQDRRTEIPAWSLPDMPFSAS
jgi:hypothetical protein